MTDVIIEWLFELLRGAIKIFLNPIFYYALFLAIILGVRRVKKERKHFLIRIENPFFELKQVFPLGILLGLIISIVSIVAGFMIPFAAVVIISFCTFILSLTTKVRLLSPAYTLGLSFFILIFIGKYGWEAPIFTDAFAQIEDAIYPSLVAILSLLVIAEGILIVINGKKATSPVLMTSKRGLKIGGHVTNRIWQVPVFLIVPGTSLQPLFEWWPVFSVGGQAYSLILVPFAIGFHQLIQGCLPNEAITKMGKKVIWFGVILAALTVGTYWLPLLSIFIAAFALIGREWLTVMERNSDGDAPPYFSKLNDGLIILGLLPDSPASKMGLQIGEKIVKVNGEPVNEEKKFYEALQKNRAFCKLEVLNTHGENRFVQRALYEGEHHQLGILFVKDEKKWEDGAE